MKPSATSRRFRALVARTVGLAGLLFSGLLLAGCGLGPGEDTGDAMLLVTRDYGAEVVVDEKVPVNESSTAMRMLDGKVDIETTYGGDFLQSVNGDEGGSKGGRYFDWFFSVNGIVAERGSAQFPAKGGDKIWWDYRDWTDAMEVGAVVGSYPAPFSTGYDDRDWGIEIECHGDEAACRMVENQLEGDGATVEPGAENIRLLVGTFGDLLPEPELKRLHRGPAASGVFATFGPGGLVSESGKREPALAVEGLRIDGSVAREFEPDAGLVAAMRRGEDPPVWLITGGTDEAVKMAAAALNPEDLERRYAAVVSDRMVSSLPLP